MPAVARTPRSSWIDAGLRALASGGPDAVRVELLAQELGVTRGGFYWHFRDRQDLLDQILDTWERRSTDEAMERAESEGGDAGRRARRAGALTFSKDALPVDLAIREWARHDPSVAERLRRVDNRRMDYLRSLIGTHCTDPDQVEARSMLAFSLAIGSHVIAADHPALDRDRVVEQAMKLLLPDE